MKKFLSVFLVLIMVLSGCSNTTDNTGTSTTEETKSDKLVVYSPNSEGLMNAVIPLFEETYGVTVEVIQAGTGELVKRIQSEKDDPYADVLFGGAHSQYIANADLWEPYVSPADSTLPEAYQNKSGFTTSYVLDGSLLIVNKDLAADIKIESYEDLLNPALKGKIAMGDPTASSSAWAELTNMLLVMGDEPYDEKAWDFVSEFVKQLNGSIISSSSQIYKATADGEYAVGVSYEDPCISLLEDGATNLKVVYPEEGAVWLPSGVAIVKGAKNMDNAKAFVDFLISEEGQKGYATTTIRPVLTSIENTSPNMPAFSTINVAYEDIAYCAEHKKEWQDRWIDLITR